MRETRNATEQPANAVTNSNEAIGGNFKALIGSPNGFNEMGNVFGKVRHTVVLDNRASTTLDSEDTSELEDDVLGGSPAVKSTGELDTNDLGGLELPGEVGHDIDGIGTTDTNGGHTETGGVGGVGVSADEETTGESVVLEDDLVDDTRAGLPETNVVLGAGGGKEVVDLLVDVDSALEILLTTNLGLNQVVAVDGGGVGNGGHASGHELEDGHLGGGILAGNAIGAEAEVRGTALNVLLMGVVQVRVEDLLSVGKGAVETAADNGEVLGHLLVVDEVTLLKKVLLDLFPTNMACQRPVALVCDSMRSLRSMRR